MVHKQISCSNKNNESLVEVHYFLPISSATLSRAGRNARQQASTAKLLFNVSVKLTSLLTLLKLPLDMVALLCFLSCCLTLLSLDE